MRDTSEKVKKKVSILHGRDAHRSHHARTKSLLFFKSEQCIMHLKRFFHRNELSEPVKMKGFWQKKVCPKRDTHETVINK